MERTRRGLIIGIVLIFLACKISLAIPPWPTPEKLKQGQPATEEVFVFTEEQFYDLLWLKDYYKIMEKEWEIKEEVYQEALKKAQKKMEVPFWKTYRAGVLSGIAFVILTAIAIGQVK